MCYIENTRMLRISRRLNATVTGLHTNLSIKAKSGGVAPIEFTCIDLIKYPSADQAILKYNDLNSWIYQRR